MRTMIAAIVLAISTQTAISQQTLELPDDAPPMVAPAPLPAEEDRDEPEITPLPGPEAGIEWRSGERTIPTEELAGEVDTYLHQDADGAVLGIYTVPAGEPPPRIPLGLYETLERVMTDSVAAVWSGRTAVYGVVKDTLDEIRDAICDFGVQPSSVTTELSVRVATVTVVWQTDGMCDGTDSPTN